MFGRGNKKKEDPLKFVDAWDEHYSLLDGLGDLLEIEEGLAWRGVVEGRYLVIEPPEPSKELLEEAKEFVLSRITLEEMGKLEDLYKEAAVRALNIKLKKGKPSDERTKRALQSLMYYLKRDIEGLGKLEPIMRDPEVEDLTLPARGSRKIYVFLSGRTGWLETNVELSEEEARFVVLKLAEKVGRQVSLARPRLEGRLPDGSRVHALFGPAASEGGTTLTVRKFVRRPGIEELIIYGTITVEAAAYLWIMVEHGMSGFIVGETGSGKTTFLNALLSLLPKDRHIVTVEDTPEIYLPEHGNWTSLIGQPPGVAAAGLSIADLLRDVLRMRPDYVVVGESRGEETRLLVQFIHLGHTALTTFHSDTLEGVIARLTSDPINLPEERVADFKVAALLRREGKRRRVVRIAEILYENEELRLNDVFTLKYDELVGDPLRSSVLFRELAQKEGRPLNEIVDEYLRRVDELSARVSKFRAKLALAR